MKQRELILVADDDPSLRQVLSVLLEEEGFSVIQAVDGADCLRMAYERHPDLILLDIMMPIKDGREVCRNLRAISDVPIIMLTCLSSQKEKIERFSDGADDYVTKPFHNVELVERIKAVLRRSRRRSEAGLWSYNDGHLRIDFEAHLARVGNTSISLSPKEWRILEYLMRQKNRVVPRNLLLRYAWGDGFEQEVSYLKVFVSHLRHKLGDQARRPRYIHTERELGYRFETHN